jgi:hypothetical protein
MVDSLARRAVSVPLIIYVKEGKVVISFHLQGELNVLVDTHQVVKFLSLSSHIWFDNESLVHITVTADGFLSNLVKCHLLIGFHEEVVDDQK